MKKLKKGEAIPKTVDEYLAGVPEPQRRTLMKVRAVIQSVLPEEATEVISYRIPVVKYKGMLVGYAAFPNHCSLFGMSGTLLGPLKEELKKYSTSKGTIRFPVDKPLPATLIKKLVKSVPPPHETQARRIMETPVTLRLWRPAFPRRRCSATGPAGIRAASPSTQGCCRRARPFPGRPPKPESSAVDR